MHEEYIAVDYLVHNGQLNNIIDAHNIGNIRFSNDAQES